MAQQFLSYIWGKMLSALYFGWEKGVTAINGWYDRL